MCKVNSAYVNTTFCGYVSTAHVTDTFVWLYNKPHMGILSDVYTK